MRRGKLLADQRPTPLEALIEDYLAFCRRQGIDEVSQLDRRALDHLASELLDQGGVKGRLSAHSVHSYLRAVNGFLSWARREGLAAEAKSHLPKLPKKLVEVLSREEIARLEDGARSYRDKLIIRVLADTGIRAGELCGLRLGDIVEYRGRGHYLAVRGKGAKDRLVPLPNLHPRLRRYLDRFRPSSDGERVFLALRKAPDGSYPPLTPSGLGLMVRGAGEAAGLTKRVYPHLLRHSFATEALARGVNPVTLAQILGHTSLAMIQQVYAHLSPGQAYEAMAQMLNAGD